MKKMLPLILALMLCLSMLTSVAYADQIVSPAVNADGTVAAPSEVGAGSEPRPRLPEVYSGAAVGDNSRKHYTEETRPTDDSPLNSVVDNPEYGNEFNFLTITDTVTGDAWRAGTMELVPGNQYLVEVYCRNDGAEDYRGREYRTVTLDIDMPYKLGAGEIQSFGARLTAGTTVNVYASIDVVARSGVSIQYVEASAKGIGDTGETSIKYEELFGDGANILGTRSLKSGRHQVASFVIQVVDDKATPAVDPNLDYDAILSAPGSGFRVMASADDIPTAFADNFSADTTDSQTISAGGLRLFVEVVGAIAIAVAAGAIGFMTGSMQAGKASKEETFDR